MKLIFHIEQVTTLEPKIVIEKLVTKLQGLKYGITSVRETEIIFTERSGLKWRHQPSQIDEGTFNLDTKGNVTHVKFTYAISYWSFLVSIIIFLGLSIFEDPGFYIW